MRLARGVVAAIATMHHRSRWRSRSSPSREPEKWEWAKGLPHTHSRVARDAIGPARMIAANWDDLMAMLPKDLAERPRFGPDAQAAGPHVIVVNDGVRVPPGDPVIGLDGMAGVTLIDLPATWGELDDPSVLRVVVGAERASEVLTTTTSRKGVTADALSVAEAEAVARRLMPLYSGPAATAGPAASTAQLELVDLLGLPDVRDIDFEVAWRG